MPEFCVTRAEADHPMPMTRPTITLSAEAYGEVATIVQETSPAVSDDTVGKYRVVGTATTRSKELSPKQMCAIAEVLAKETRTKSVEDFEPARQLRRRLCQPVTLPAGRGA